MKDSMDMVTLMRRWSVLLAFVLVAAACGDVGGSDATTDAQVAAPVETRAATGGERPDGEPVPGSGSAQAERGVAGSESGEPAATAPEVKVAPEGPSAPDFSLALGYGGTYTLSEGAKPVYLVFWAEW